MSVERLVSGARHLQLFEGPIEGGRLSLGYFQAIHKHLFQDIYSWAGEIRTEDIAKNGTPFCSTHRIKPYMGDLFTKLRDENFLKGLGIDQFAKRLAFYASEINAVHPFREGNGRSTREFIRCLAHEAGYIIDYSLVHKNILFKAFVDSFGGDYLDLQNVFKLNILDTIANQYVNELPVIISAPNHLLELLNKVRSFSSDQEFLSIKKINDLYKKLGSRIELGFGQDDSTFDLISNAVLEIRELQVKTPVGEKGKDITKGLVKHELEQ